MRVTMSSIYIDKTNPSNVKQILQRSVQLKGLERSSFAVHTVAPPEGHEESLTRQ